MEEYETTGDKERMPIVPSQENQNSPEEPAENGHVQKRGLSMFMATVLLFGEMAGTGLLVLPGAVEQSGIPGIIYLFVNFTIMAFTAKLVGQAWLLVRERFPEYRGHVRYPYPAIGQVAYGAPGRLIVSGSLMATMYGSVVSLLILVSDNVGQLINGWGFELPFYFRCLAVATVLILPMLLGTPKDFWPVGVGAALFSLISAVLIFSSIIYDCARQENGPVEHVTPTFRSTSMALGVMCFVLGGHPIFPTIQTDMNDDKEAVNAILTSLLSLACILVLISLSAYFVYGIDTMDNILFNLPSGPILYAVQILMNLHFFLACVIVMNPVFQQVEDTLNVPKEFNWKRCMSRTALLATIVLLAILIPHFSLVISLLGGSTMITLTTICPPAFYYKLSTMEGKWEKIYVTLGEKMLYCFIIAYGVISGVLCTYSAIYTLATLQETESTESHNFTARQWL